MDMQKKIQSAVKKAEVLVEHLEKMLGDMERVESTTHLPEDFDDVLYAKDKTIEALDALKGRA